MLTPKKVAHKWSTGHRRRHGPRERNTTIYTRRGPTSNILLSVLVYSTSDLVTVFCEAPLQRKMVMAAWCQVTGLLPSSSFSAQLLPGCTMSQRGTLLLVAARPWVVVAESVQFEVPEGTVFSDKQRLPERDPDVFYCEVSAPKVFQVEVLCRVNAIGVLAESPLERSGLIGGVGGHTLAAPRWDRFADV